MLIFKRIKDHRVVSEEKIGIWALKNLNSKKSVQPDFGQKVGDL